MIAFFAFLTIIFISLYAFYPSFNLAVFGDFWVTLWRYELLVGELSKGIWNHFTYLHTLYGSQDILTGLLSKIIGYDSFSFYFASYLLRMAAAFSFYPLVFYLTKNKLSVYIAILFFSTTTIGLETTNWVFNMSSYITVLFFNIFLYFLLKSKEGIYTKLFTFVCPLFYLTIISSPIRTTGFFPFVIIIELLWLIKNYSSLNLKKTVLRLSLLSLIFFILLTKTAIFTTPDIDSQKVTSGTGNIISKSMTSFKSINLKSLADPVTILGGMFLPNMSGERIPFYLLAGVLVITIWLFILLFYKKSEQSQIIFISLLWFFLSFIIPWFWGQTSYPTTHRYLIVSAIGITLFLSGMVAVVKNKQFQPWIIILVLLITLVHIDTTNNYFSKLLTVRNQSLSKKIWSQMPNFPLLGKTEGPLVFYFEGDNPETVFNAINFGFPQKIQLLNKVADRKSLVTALNFEELISAVNDGKSLTKHVLPEIPVPLENIYTFYLKNDGTLINSTNTSRDKLSKL